MAVPEQVRLPLAGVMPPGPTNPTDPTQPTNPGTPTTAEVHSNALSGRVQQYFDETGNWGLLSDRLNVNPPDSGNTDYLF